MNVIFLTLTHFSNIKEKGIYTDLMRKFRDEGHVVYVVSPNERRLRINTSIVQCDGVYLLNVRTLNINQTKFLEKGLETLLIGNQYIKAIKRYLKSVKFDLITYSTPPITFTNVVKYLKRVNPNAVSYLQLKDIFPQNAVDLCLFAKKSIFHWYFRRKEIALYMN